MRLLTVTQPVLRPFRVDDVDMILNRDGQQVTSAAILEQAQHGPAMTAEVDGAPIACAGLVLPWPGIGMAWMVLSDEMSEHGVWLTRTVRNFLRDSIRTYDLHRLEAVAVEGMTRNHRWLTSLGFTSEKDGTARQFLADRRNVVRYEWVREE